MLDCFQTALGAVAGDTLTARALAGWSPTAPVRLVAVGKASEAMAAGAAGVLGSRLHAGLVVAPDSQPPRGGRLESERLRCLRAAHPVPDEASLAAGRALIEFLKAAPGRTQWLFLISGGTSSLVEVLPNGASLAQLRELNRQLLGGGIDITAMNARRRRLSRIKGGGLLDFLRDRPVRALYLSDVPGNDPAVIGSGLLAGRPSSEARRIDHEILADNATACRALARAARSVGGPVRVHAPRLDGEAEAAGRAIARTLRSEPGIHVWGGECTVNLPDNPGKGGRCQQLALAAARELAGAPGCCLLAAGTDGRDGDSEVAGALVDGGTVERGRAQGLDALRCLKGADAHRFLAASGDLVDTGTTGTNVNDVVVGWHPAQDAPGPRGGARG